MAIAITLTAPTGEKYFGSKADVEGLRYRVSQIEDVEHFSSRYAAENAVRAFRQIRELGDYSYEVVEV